MQAPVSYGSLIGAVTFLRHADRTPKSKAKLESTGDIFPATTMELLKLLTPIPSSSSSSVPKDVTSYIAALATQRRETVTPPSPTSAGTTISVTSHCSTSSPTAAAVLVALQKDMSGGRINNGSRFTKQLEGASRKICALIAMASMGGEPSSTTTTTATNLQINTKLKVTVEVPTGDASRPSQVNIRLSCAIGGTLTQSGAEDCVMLGRQYLSHIASHRYTTPSRSLWANTRTAPDVQLYANYKDRVRKSAQLFINPVLEALQEVNPPSSEGDHKNGSEGNKSPQVVVPVHIDMLDYRPPEAAQRMSKHQAILQQACMYEPTDEAPYHPVITTQLSLDGRLEFKALAEATITHLNELVVCATRDALSPFYFPDMPRRELPLASLVGVMRLLGQLVDMLVEGLHTACQRQNEPATTPAPEPHISVTSPERSSLPPRTTTTAAAARPGVMLEMSTRYDALQEKLQPTKEEGTNMSSTTNATVPFYLNTAEIPDMYDSLTHDLKHHRHDIHQSATGLLPLFCLLHNYTKSVTLLVQAVESGFDRQERAKTASLIAGPLLQYVRSKVSDALHSSSRSGTAAAHTFLYVFVMSRMHITAVRTLLTTTSNSSTNVQNGDGLHHQSTPSPAIQVAMGLSAGFLSEVTMTLWRPVGGNHNSSNPSVEVDTVSSMGQFGLGESVPDRTVASTRVPLQRTVLAQPL